MTQHLEELIVTVEDPYHPDAIALVQRLSAELRARYDYDGSGEFRPEDVQVPRAAFVVARRAGQPVGCGALRPLGTPDLEPTAEIKRMFVTPEARRCGVARGVLERLEDLARGFGYTRIMLQTGNRQPDAIRLYERTGYTRVPCYGTYAKQARSVCFAKQLAAADE